jgi:hypothetical protein
MQMTILLFGILEMIIGFSGALLADFFSVFSLLTVLSGLAGLTALIFCCLYIKKLNIYDLMAMAIVFGYGTGSLNTLISFTLDGLNILKFAVVEEYWLSFSLGLATASAGILHVIGRFHNTSALFLNFELCADQKNRALLIIIFIFFLVILLLYSGNIGFMGDTRLAGYVNVSPIAATVSFLILPVGILAFYLGLKEESKVIKFILMLLAVLLLLIMFGLGRRVFALSTIIYLMVFFFNFDTKKLLSVKSLVIFFLVVIILQIATTTFAIMRIATYSNQNTTKKNSIVELIPRTIDIYKDYERLNLDEQIHKNISTRTFVLGYLALLVKASSKFEPTHGTLALRALVFSTPGILYQGKYQSKLFVDEESIVGNQFGLSTLKDNANSFLTAGVADFGIYGLFAYPLIICLLYSVFLNTINGLVSPVRYLFISTLVCYNAIALEQDLVGFLLNLRNILIALFLTWLFFEFNSKKH